MTAGLVAEQVVLGRLLDGTASNNDYLYEALSVLAPAAFREPRHQKVFSAIADLHLEGTPVGIHALQEKLGAAGTLEAVGGYQGLTELTYVAVSEPVSAPARYLAQIADDYAAHAAQQRLRLIADTMSAGDMSLDEARVQVEQLFETQSRVAGQLPDLNAQLGSVLDDLDYRVTHPGVMRGIPTGWEDLDGGGSSARRLIGGLRPPWLVIIAARPSVGKTTVLLDWIRAAASSGHGVLFASCEMSAPEILQRAIVAECATVTITDFMLQPETLNSVQREQIENAAARIDSWDLVIDDTITTVPDWLSSAAAARIKFRAGGGDLHIQFQDYIQLLQDPPGSASPSDVQRIGNNSIRTKLLAKRMETPVVVAAQFNRDAIDSPRADKLGGSGQLERDADLLIALERPYATDPRGAEEKGLLPNDMTAHLLKFRHGQAGQHVSRDYVGAFCRSVEPGRFARRVLSGEPTSDSPSAQT